jgi:hypothetical protein
MRKVLKDVLLKTTQQPKSDRLELADDRHGENKETI